MSDIRSLQIDRNSAGRDRRTAFAGHRARVMHCLTRFPKGKLLLAGAGNCNDVELNVLTETFDEVHLVDIDVDIDGGTVIDGGTANDVAVGRRVQVEGSVTSFGNIRADRIELL